MTEAARALHARNPRTGEVDYEYVAPSADEVARTADRLRAAQRGWYEAGIAGRVAILERWAVALEGVTPEMAAALTADTGRVVLSRSEAAGAARKVRRWCRLAPGYLAESAQRSEEAPHVSFRSQYVPYALAGIISPWNFPLSLALIDALPALVAGCAVLIKPSEVTPRFVEPLRRSIAAVPELAAVLEVLSGDGAVGAAVVDNVDIVAFTGSVPTGRAVARQAAGRFIPAFLELGGKDPAVVLASADLERAADAILRQSVVNSGQVCLSIERVYVHASVHDRFAALLVARARALELNHPDANAGHLGPLISAAQAAIVDEQLADARAQGARALSGGFIEDHGGKWCRATVLTNVHHGMKIMRDETFGPLIPLMPFGDADEAVALANDTPFGLSAAVFAGTEEEALEVARRLDAGAVSINDAGLQSVTTEAEKMSFGVSGLGGSRMGPAGLMRFVRKKALMIQHGTPRTMEAFRESAPGP